MNASVSKEEMTEKIADLIIERTKQRAEKGLEPLKARFEAGDIVKLANEEGWPSGEVGDYVKYMRTPEGRDEFRRTIGYKLWMAGFRPKGWEE